MCRGRRGLTAACARIPVCLLLLPAYPESSGMLRGKSCFNPAHIPQGPRLSHPRGCTRTEEYHLLPRPLSNLEATLQLKPLEALSIVRHPLPFFYLASLHGDLALTTFLSEEAGGYTSTYQLCFCVCVCFPVRVLI